MTDSIGTTGCGCRPAGPEVLRENWVWFLALGLSMVLVGTLAITLPALAGLGVTLLLGWLLVIGGVVQGVHAFTAGRWRGFLVAALSAVLYVLAGSLVLVHPLVGLFTLTVLLAAFLWVDGCCRILLAFHLRPAAHWGWVALSGLLALVLGTLIWSGLPGDSLWAVGVLVGVNIVLNGASTTMLALAARDALKATHPGGHMPSHA